MQPLFLNNVMLHGNRNKQISAIFKVVGNEFTWQIYHAHPKKEFFLNQKTKRFATLMLA